MTLILLILSHDLSAQTNDLSQTAEVKKVITTLFDGMRAGDTSQLRSLFHADHEMHSLFTTRGGDEVLDKGKLNGFIAAVGDGHTEVWDERVGDMQVLIDDRMAVVWAPYHFYLGEAFSHCGVNTFLLVYENDRWQILELTDTRRRENCE